MNEEEISKELKFELKEVWGKLGQTILRDGKEIDLLTEESGE